MNIAACIYCRVSSEHQENEGTSLDTQREACLKYCKEKDYIVTHQFVERWSGLSLERPKLDELRDLIRSEVIQVVVCHSLDRLSRDPVHGVIISQELERHGVVLEAVTETVDSTEIGKLISYIKGFAAKLEAEKIRERTMRGTRANVFRDRRPVTFRKPYGYKWDKTGKYPKLVPDSNYDNAKLIIDLSLNGKSYDYIIAELAKRGIESPNQLPEWNKHTISGIIRNPVYAGQYYAFKSEVVTPRKRNGNSYGKSSVKRLPQNQWHYIPEIAIVNPPMTLDQRALLLERLQQRQKYSSRNARREYLLRGRGFCYTHRGKAEEPRAYHGQPRGSKWRYACPIGGCDNQYIDGIWLEYFITGFILDMMVGQPDEFYEKLIQDKASVKTQITAELKKLDKEHKGLITKLSNLEDSYLGGRYSDNIGVYTQLQEQYSNKVKYINERRDAILGQLSQLDREAEAVNNINNIRREVFANIGELFHPYAQMKDGEISQIPKDIADKWRHIFDLLNLQIIIHPNNAEGKYIHKEKIGRKLVSLEIKMAIPLPIEKARDIALPNPENELHNQQYYPIRFPLSDIIPKVEVGR